MLRAVWEVRRRENGSTHVAHSRVHGGNIPHTTAVTPVPRVIRAAMTPKPTCQSSPAGGLSSGGELGPAGGSAVGRPRAPAHRCRPNPCARARCRGLGIIWCELYGSGERENGCAPLSAAVDRGRTRTITTGSSWRTSTLRTSRDGGRRPSCSRAMRREGLRSISSSYYGEGVGRRSLARLLTRDAAPRIAAGIANIPELLKRA